MHAIKQNPIKGARVGVVVRRISDGKEIASDHGNELYELASNTKLFTTAAALHRLGVDYEFSTLLIADGKVVNGKLDGNLIVVGGGDPNLSGRFHKGDIMFVPDAMAAAVAEAGITEIGGDLVMDDRLFDREFCAPGWPDEEKIWWYGAPVSALSFNDNCVEVGVSGDAKGAAAKIKLTPDLPVLKIRNSATAVARGQKSAIQFHREGDVLVVDGDITVGDPRSDDITVLNPPLYFAAALHASLRQKNISVRGADRLVRNDEKTGPDAKTLFDFRSKLTDSIAVANRRSQNFYAEQILKTIGAKVFGRGSFKDGAKAVMDFAASAHLPEGTVKIVDGCGLSSGNQATPQAVAALLEVMYKSNMRDAYFKSLAVNGDRETTLKYRMPGKALAGRIHAKTGTIKNSGISALSGYVVAADNEVYAFSVLANGFTPGRLGQTHKLEDAVCEALAKSKVETTK